MIGMAWMAEEPVPMMPRRLPVKSTPSWGQRPVWYVSPRKLSRPCELGKIRRRQASGRHDHEAGGHRLARVRRDQPPVPDLIEVRTCHAGIEGDVPAQVEPIGDVVGVAKDLRLTGVALRPFPFLLQFVGETVGVLHALDVAARAGVAVPVPGAADAVAGLEYAGAETGAAQPVQHVEAGETGAYDDHVGVWLVRHGHTPTSVPKSRDSTQPQEGPFFSEVYTDIYSIL